MATSSDGILFHTCNICYSAKQCFLLGREFNLLALPLQGSQPSAVPPPPPPPFFVFRTKQFHARCKHRKTCSEVFLSAFQFAIGPRSEKVSREHLHWFHGLVPLLREREETAQDGGEDRRRGTPLAAAARTAAAHLQARQLEPQQQQHQDGVHRALQKLAKIESSTNHRNIKGFFSDSSSFPLLTSVELFGGSRHETNLPTSSPPPPPPPHYRQHKLEQMARDGPPPPPTSGGGVPRHPGMSQAELQHWVVVGILTPILIALYLVSFALIKL